MKVCSSITKHLALSFFAISAMFTQTAFAYDETDKAQIEERIAIIDTSIETGDFSPLIDSMPPKLVSHIAQLGGVPPEMFLEFVKAQANSIIPQNAVIDYEIDLANAGIHQTSINRDYLIIPTHMVMKINGETYEAADPLLALEDNDEWYLLRVVGGQSTEMIADVYPDFAGVLLTE